MDVITFPENLWFIILLHGVISIPDATSYDNMIIENIENYLSYDNTSRNAITLSINHK